MNAPTSILPPPPPLVPEALDLLAIIDLIPLEDCRHGFSMFDATSRGWEVDTLREYARRFKTTPAIVGVMWHKNGPPKGYENWFRYFFEAIEFAVREQRAVPT